MWYAKFPMNEFIPPSVMLALTERLGKHQGTFISP